MFSLLPLKYKLIVFGLAVLILLAGGYWLYDRTWDKGYNQHKLEVAAETAQILVAHNAELVRKGIQHDLDQATINRLAADVKRLRVKFPLCPSVTPPNDTGGSSGTLPDSVDAAFADFQGKVGSLIERCDILNAAAIRANP